MNITHAPCLAVIVEGKNKNRIVEVLNRVKNSPVTNRPAWKVKCASICYVYNYRQRVEKLRYEFCVVDAFLRPITPPQGTDVTETTKELETI